MWYVGKKWRCSDENAKACKSDTLGKPFRDGGDRGVDLFSAGADPLVRQPA